MNSISFESAREKQIAREELKRTREDILKKAQEKAEYEAFKKLKDGDWVLPSVAKKINSLNKISKKSHKKKSKKKHDKQLKHKKKKKRKSKKRSSSSSSRGSSDTSPGDSSSDGDEGFKQNKSKHKNKISNASSDIAAYSELQRDSWMTESALLKTYSNNKSQNTKPKQTKIDTYDPASSSRELNPYWKMTGTGLPNYQKPNSDSDDEQLDMPGSSNKITNIKKRNWQTSHKKTNSQHIDADEMDSSSSASSEDLSYSVNDKQNYLTDAQMNELGAKILKAELIGNEDLVIELKQKLDEARKLRSTFKEGSKKAESTIAKIKVSSEEHVLLSITDEKGNCRPMAHSTKDPYKIESDSGSNRKKPKRVVTHEDGHRIRYFADDDKYDIKQMFEREKYSSAAESNMQFANVVSKYKNPNDDLEDIFAEKIQRVTCQDDIDKKEMQKAINQHQKLSYNMANCEKCIDSSKIEKKLLMSIGDKCYISLPSYIGLQPGHCLIVPRQHAPSCTHLDEDTWEEIQNYRKALSRMFSVEQQRDVIFFEIANRYHKYPHTYIHCVPIPKKQSEMAPFYFKKAIEESEQEWSINKQLITLKNKSLRSCIPKGLPYFWVHFGMTTGFAHVIEDESRFPSTFAHEIIGGILKLETHKWRNPRKDQNIILQLKRFADLWKKYDFST